MDYVTDFQNANALSASLFMFLLSAAAVAMHMFLLDFFLSSTIWSRVSCDRHQIQTTKNQSFILCPCPPQCNCMRSRVPFLSGFIYFPIARWWREEEWQKTKCVPIEWNTHWINLFSTDRFHCLSLSLPSLVVVYLFILFLFRLFIVVAVIVVVVDVFAVIRCTSN